MKLQYSSFFISSLSLFSVSYASVVMSSTNDWKPSQMDFGGTGLMQMPSGRMAEEGEFNVGISVNNDYHHYVASMQVMPWLDATIRYTRLPNVLYNSNPDYSGDNLYTDKGMDFKVRLIEESYWLPETSIGLRDFGGTGMFDGEFVAATKRFGNLDFTLGLGWGYIGQSGNVSNPVCKISDRFCNRPSDFKDTGGMVDYGRWFKGPAALFGGIEYQTPYEPLRIKIEYDGNDYSEDWPQIRANSDMTQHTPWNIGINYRLGDWGDAKVSYQRGDTLTLGFNFYTNFNHMKASWLDTPKTKVQASPTSNDWQQASAELQHNAGYQQNTIAVSDNKIIVTGEQVKYRDRDEALERAAAVLTRYGSDDITEFHIIEQNNSMVLTETIINRDDYISAANYDQLGVTPSSTFDKYQEPTPLSSPIVAQSIKRWDYGLSPSLQQSLGGPEAFYLFSLGLSAHSNYWITPKLELGGAIYINIVDNYDKFNYGVDSPQSPHVRNEATPRVRTMFRSYVQDPVRLSQLQLTWFEQPTENIYTQVYGGYLESMFAGVGGEILYRPMRSNWAVGVDMNYLSQREADSWFGIYSDDYFYYDGSNPNSTTCINNPTSCRAYVLNQGTTGHLTTYYTPDWAFLESTLFKISAGKFLGGDIGARVDFSKQFKSGVIAGVYAVFTDLTADEYGEGSYNKGFYVSIPFDIMTVKPSTNRAILNWEPITRDGGQMLRKKHQLYDRTDARSPWSQRPNTSQ